jgi:hydroxymethylpyrimidine pyrophosphatase-like HAD family hydrolase
MCTIAIDYDGTISADLEGARKALTELKEQGHRLIVWSSRNNPMQHGDQCESLMIEMINTLNVHKIPYDEVDMGYVGKFHAQVYIDDKAWRFENNWDEIIKKIY